MKGKAIIPLVVGLAIGVLAIRQFSGVLSRAKGKTTIVAPETVSVVRARSDIGATMAVTEGMLELVEVPKSLVPRRVFHEVEPLLGRVVSQPIPKGVPLIPEWLAPLGTPPGLAAKLRTGYRAMAIKIDEIAGVAGWLKPGSHVDVSAVLTAPGRGGRGGSVSKIILQDILVLTVGQAIQSEGPGARVTRSVTLELDPRQVTKLHLAATRGGRLQLAMRHPEDEDTPPSIITSDIDLLSDDPEEDREGQDALDRLKGSFLANLLLKEREVEPVATDKNPEPEVSAPPVVVVAPPPIEEPEDKQWTVQVVSSTRQYAVRFASDSGDARRVKGGPRPPAPAPQPRADVKATGAEPQPTPADPAQASPAKGTEAGPPLRQWGAPAVGAQAEATPAKATPACKTVTTEIPPSHSGGTAE